MEKDNFDPRSPYMTEGDDPAQQKRLSKKKKSWRLSKWDKEGIKNFVESVIPGPIELAPSSLEDVPDFIAGFLDFDYSNSWNKKREKAVMTAFRRELISYYPNNYLDLAALREAKAE